MATTERLDGMTQGGPAHGLDAKFQCVVCYTTQPETRLLDCIECGYVNNRDELCRVASFDLFLGKLIDAKDRAVSLRGQAAAEAKACAALESRAPSGFWAWHSAEEA